MTRLFSAFLCGSQQLPHFTLCSISKLNRIHTIHKNDFQLNKFLNVKLASIIRKYSRIYLRTGIEHIFLKNALNNLKTTEGKKLFIIYKGKDVRTPISKGQLNKYKNGQSIRIGKS